MSQSVNWNSPPNKSPLYIREYDDDDVFTQSSRHFPTSIFIARRGSCLVIDSSGEGQGSGGEGERCVSYARTHTTLTDVNR